MINSVAKAMDILDFLSENDGKSVRLEELSGGTGINKSTCVHILETLMSKRYVEKVSRSEGYRLGFGIYYLTRFGKYGRKLCDNAHPVLRWLNKKTGKSPVLVILRDGKRISIDYISGEMPLSQYGEDIIVESIYNAATGRVLLAHLSDFELDEFCTKYGLPDKTDWDVGSFQQLKKELRHIKKQGYEIMKVPSDGRDSCGCAVPIFENELCVASIGLAFYTEPDEEYLGYLKAAAAEIQRRLEYNGGKAL